MAIPQYIVAASYLRGDKLVASAVIYPSTVDEPSFAYPVRGETRVVSLSNKEQRIPVQYVAALDEYIRHTAVSWSQITAHASCTPEPALALAVVRAVERWVCRCDTLPNISALEVHLPSKQQLVDLPSNLRQVIGVNDWRIAAARLLCRYRLSCT